MVVGVQERRPMDPKTAPFSVSWLHDSSVDGGVSINEKIRLTSFCGRVHKCQQSFCGGGNVFEKEARKRLGLVEWGRDATSAITLWMPVMWSTLNGAAPTVRSLLVRTLRMRLAVGSREQRYLLVQETATVLSALVATET